MKNMAASFFVLLLLSSVALLLVASPASAAPSSKWPWYTTVPAAVSEELSQAQPAAPISEKHHRSWFPPCSGEDVKKCWEAVRKEKETCMHDVVRSFWTHKVAIDGTCCAAIAKVSDDCFKPFGNPFFAMVLRLHCANHHVGAPTP